jgi:hypothetical protein
MQVSVPWLTILIYLLPAEKRNKCLHFLITNNLLSNISTNSLIFKNSRFRGKAVSQKVLF